MITLRTFVDGLEALSITGVTRSYLQGPPTSGPVTADLPALFIAYPTLTGSRLTLGNQGGNGTLTAQLYILVEPVAQNMQGANYDATVAMVDALETALIAAACSIGGALSWSVRVTTFEVAGEAYWTVIADMEGRRW